MEQIKLKGNISTKIGFGEGLRIAGERNQNLIALGSDITSSVGLNIFKEAFP
jgi:transketolase